MRITCVLLSLLLGRLWSAHAGASPPDWAEVPVVSMSGKFHVFWNVGGGDNAVNDREAEAHGFELARLVNAYADYEGGQRRNLYKHLERSGPNPWSKPGDFEEVVKRNIARAGTGAIVVNDIELPFALDASEAWMSPEIRKQSGATMLQAFAEKSASKWAEWYVPPCAWAKESSGGRPIGIYGLQPVPADYWGILHPSAKSGQVRATVEQIWRHVDPVVDFYVASVYAHYDDPGFTYYVAANVESNYAATRRYGDKPIYAYVSLKYHPSNAALGGKELSPEMVEASAIVPFFFGARGVVLWGWEPGRKGQYFERLPLFARHLSRVAQVSERLSGARPLPGESAAAAWKKKSPLVRAWETSAAGACLIMAVDPWQEPSVSRAIRVACADRSAEIQLDGRHVAIAELDARGVKRY